MLSVYVLWYSMNNNYIHVLTQDYKFQSKKKTFLKAQHSMLLLCEDEKKIKVGQSHKKNDVSLSHSI